MLLVILGCKASTFSKSAISLNNISRLNFVLID